MLFVGVINSGIDWNTVAAFLSAIAAVLSWCTARTALKVSRQAVSVSLMERREEAYLEMEKVFHFFLELNKHHHIFSFPSEGRESFSIRPEEIVFISKLRATFLLYAPSLGVDLGGRCNAFLEDVFDKLDQQRDCSEDEEKKARKIRIDFEKKARVLLKEIEVSLYLSTK